MKKILGILILISFLSFNGFDSVYAIDDIPLGNVQKSHVEVEKSPKVVKGSLLISGDQMLDELIELQKRKDLEDIEILWKGTIENNKVIAFALQKLATPESQRRIHSSLMAKTLSAIISGASFVPAIMGTDPSITTGSFAAGRLAQTLLNRKTTPQEIPLTDTELIELAGLVEDLQDKIIDAYYSYKSSLGQIKESRQKLLLYQKNYTKALDKGDILDISISSSLYDQMALQEFYYVQNAKKYHLELQRLAGKKAMDNLNLYQYNFNSALFKTKNSGMNNLPFHNANKKSPKVVNTTTSNNSGKKSTKEKKVLPINIIKKSSSQISKSSTKTNINTKQPSTTTNFTSNKGQEKPIKAVVVNSKTNKIDKKPAKPMFNSTSNKTVKKSVKPVVNSTSNKTDRKSTKPLATSTPIRVDKKTNKSIVNTTSTKQKTKTSKEVK